jgi:O-acetyl-ADP-ribose deacetylase (regulator of RNase III)
MSIDIVSSFFKKRIIVVTGDITTIHVQAIVNAANSSLMGGGGVDGAIHRAAGPALLSECKRIRAETLPNGLPTGQAVISGAGKLSAQFVIHTVGPVWSEVKKDALDILLAECYSNSLILATQNNIITVAFPAISTGVYGYPKDRAACIAFNTVKDYLTDHAIPEIVYFVFFNETDTTLFLNSIKIS